MPKTDVMIAVSLIAVVALAGCGGSDSSTSGDTPPVSAPDDATSKAATESPPVQAAGTNTRAPVPPTVTGSGAINSPPTGPLRPVIEDLTRAGSRVTFDRLAHDFGQIWDVEVVETVFTFENSGTKHLSINDVKPSCGCTVPSLDKTRFAPGESAELRVQFKPKDAGQQEKYIDVVTNSMTQPILRLTISAVVIPFAKIEPDPVVFGTVQLGQEHVIKLTVDSYGGSLDVKTIKTHMGAVMAEKNDYLSVEHVEGSNDPMEFIATLSKDAPWGTSYGSIVIDCTANLEGSDQPRTSSLDTRVSVTVFGDVHADKTVYNLGFMTPGDKFNERIRLWRPSKKPFSLSANTRDEDMAGLAIRTEPIVEDGIVGYEIIVSGDTTDFTGVIDGYIDIVTDVPGEEKLSIKLSGMVRG